MNAYLKTGLIPDKFDPRDYKAFDFGIEPLLTSGTIELDLPDVVYNQGITEMCTAFASTMMMLILNGGHVEFSQADIYAQKSTPGEGGQLRDILKKLLYRGVAPKMLYDHLGTFEECKQAYNQNKDKADFMAELGRIRHYYKAESEADIAAALSKGLPVLLGVPVHSNFIPDANNHIPMPAGPQIAGHALCGVGYKPGYVKVINSAGSNWGDNGCAWVPYEMIFDCWVALDASLELKTVYFQIGNTSYYKNGVEVPMDVAPFIQNGRTFVPLAHVCNALDKPYIWIESVQGIEIKG